MDVRWLQPDERDAWLRFIAVLELLPAGLDSQLRRDSGLTHFEYLCLVVLADAPDGRLRMSDLAVRSNATPARLSRVVQRLVERGCLERARCTEDARSIFAVLTDEGRAVLSEAAPGHLGFVREHVFDPLSPEQVSALREISDRLLATLDPDAEFGVER